MKVVENPKDAIDGLINALVIINDMNDVIISLALKTQKLEERIIVLEAKK